jgi:curved DNA-binding protein CbpA
MGRDTYYDILGLSSGATSDEIKARYRSLILRVHPDVDGPTALFRQVQEAYEVLSDPVRRASYDRWLVSDVRAAKSSRPPSRWWDRDQKGLAGSNRSATRPQRRNASRSHGRTSPLSRNPAGTVAIAGLILLLFGAALGPVGLALMLLGAVALVIAGVAALGARGAKEREAYQRSGMSAVDAMSRRQFEALLEHFFANKGYRVARIGARRYDYGADLLLKDAHERVIVQARRWSGLVPHDSVHEVIAAKAHYGAARALVVTSSDYSQHAVMLANSNGVTLWNRATLAAQLTDFRAQPFRPGFNRLSTELRAGTRMCLGFFALVFVAVVVVSTRVRKAAPAKARSAS